MGFDTLAVSAHKLYGPKGVGCLIRRPDVKLTPLLRGGGQEGGIRSGTENVPGMAGFGAAAAEASALMNAEGERLVALRERLYRGLAACDVHLRRNSRQHGCLPNTLHVSAIGIDATAMLAELDANGIAASAGSACHAGSATSSALRHIGLDSDALHGTLRLSLGRDTNEAAIDHVIAIFRDALECCREE